MALLRLLVMFWGSPAAPKQGPLSGPENGHDEMQRTVCARGAVPKQGPKNGTRNWAIIIGPTFHSICGRVVVLCLGLPVHGCVQGKFVCIPCPREGPQEPQKKSQKCAILRARFGGQKMAPFLGPLYLIVNKRAHFGVHFLDPKRGPQNVLFLRWLCNPISKSQNAASLTLWSNIFHGRHLNLRVGAAFHA